MSSGAVCRVMSPTFPCVVGANAEAVPQEGKLKDMNPLIAFHVRRVFQLRNLTFPELSDIKKKILVVFCTIIQHFFGLWNSL